jgi:hypothetical protein
MDVRWRKLFARTTLWLAEEILLGLIGLDTLANYGEFVFEHHQQHLVTLQVPSQLQSRL